MVRHEPPGMRSQESQISVKPNSISIYQEDRTDHETYSYCSCFDLR
jgi:hypothetical protein